MTTTQAGIDLVSFLGSLCLAELEPLYTFWVGSNPSKLCKHFTRGLLFTNRKIRTFSNQLH